MDTTTAAAQTARKYSTLEQIGSILIVALIVYLIYCKKKRKNPIAPIIRLVKMKKNSSGRNVEVTKTDRVPPVSKRKSPWYGDYNKLISIQKFQKVAFDEYTVFDLETTGLDAASDKIVEIGAVKVRNGKIVDSYQQLVNPGVHIPKDATEKNHITDSMVKKAPKIEDVLPGFLSFVGDNVLAAHNGGYDASFLDNACLRHGFPAPKAYFDTMRLNVYWPGLPNRKLATFLEAAGIENDEAHRALSDAEATAKLLIMSMEKIA